MSVVHVRDVANDAARFAVKCFALVAMVIDHADWLLHDSAYGFHDTWGRTVFPIFAALLAYNLARVPVDAMLSKLVPRMLAFGALAFAPYVALQGSVLPLNIMFTLAAAVLVVYLQERRLYLPAVVALLGAGMYVDYAWFGLLAVVLPWYMVKRGMPGGLFVAALCVVPVNGSLWSLAVVVPAVLASTLSGNAPRLKWLFYTAYPLHLAALWLFAAFAG